MIKKLFWLRHFSCPHIATGQISTHGIHKMKAKTPQLCHILSHNWIFIHSRIHRWCNKNRTSAGQYCRRQHIISNAPCKLSNDICCCWCNHHNICLLGQCNMFHMKLKISVKGVHHTFMPCQCLKRNWIDKIGRILCHQHIGVCPLFYKCTGQIGDLIGRNATTNSQYHCLSF